MDYIQRNGELLSNDGKKNDAKNAKFINSIINWMCQS